MSLTNSNIIYSLQREIITHLSKSKYLKDVCFLSENDRDIEYGIKNALGKTGLVGIIMTPSLSYIGLITANSNDQLADLAWDAELTIQILENVPVNRAKGKESILTAQDVGIYCLKYLCSYNGLMCTRFNPIDIETTQEDNTLVAVNSNLQCTVIDKPNISVTEHLNDEELDAFYKQHSIYNVDNGLVYTPYIKSELEYSDTWSRNGTPAILNYDSEDQTYKYHTIEDQTWYALKYSGTRWQLSGRRYQAFINGYWPGLTSEYDYSTSTFMYIYDDNRDEYVYCTYNGIRDDYKTPYIWINQLTQTKIYLHPKWMADNNNLYVLTSSSNDTVIDRIEIVNDQRYGFKLDGKKFEFI